MEQSTNALAELAAMLEKIHIRYDLWPGHATAIGKAQRIVAELAKVADWVNDYGADEPEPYRSVSAIKDCRAIAEEGVGDGK